MGKLLATQDIKDVLFNAELTTIYCEGLLLEGVRCITYEYRGRGILEHYRRGTNWTEEQAAYYWMTDELDGLLSIIQAAQHLTSQARVALETLPATEVICKDAIVLNGGLVK